ncbi:MBL fold metallo-hydrolase [Dethiobacter alkaliphilus]|uniref:MBL fold metallo-hydrolase n=1 Tax=Dethiobacter alkaliphilus TaxID=427926 RepID=UPI0022274506|nr:MBL fold metallo-hydrolase [Dethiobacter alkaliphilus]MCW3491590.1 MBL fold metallo-hydrolase [Dethiobacter alkaliphilus]
MIQQVYPGIHKIDVPIPNNPLKSLNCYIIQSGGRHLMIDTGFNREECLQVLKEAIHKLNVDLKKTDILITHMHADHSGLVADLAAEGATAYCSAEDADTINADATHWEAMRIFTMTGGFPPEVFQNAIEKHPGYKYRSTVKVDFNIVDDGDQFPFGDFEFTCIKTPGHTRGHMCLYEPDKKIFISGDHILQDITPNISLWSDKYDPLHDYLQSLDRVNQLEISLVLPGHRSLIKDCGGRIKELQEHHETRAQEVIDILKSDAKSAYEVAAEMTWDMTYDSFEEFPVAQKWFATGEALAHLKYLEGRGRLTREKNDNIIYYKIV